MSKTNIYQVHISKYSRQQWDPLTTLYTLHIYLHAKNDEDEKVAKMRQPLTLITRAVPTTHVNQKLH